MHARLRLFGVEIDVVRMDDAVRWVLEAAKGPRGKCQFVVTPNADHALMLRHHEGLNRAYGDASLVVADGWPVVLTARILAGAPLERIAGSSLVPEVFEAASPANPLRVYLLGAGPGVAERAGLRVERRYPGVRVVGAYSPPFGFERDEAECQRILAALAAADADVVLVGLGAPKQELWVHAHQDKIDARVALCVGATIDFLAGEKSRAPVWMQRVGLEWFHRMVSEPRRLVPRYAANAVEFPRLVYDEWRSRRAAP